MVAKNVLDLQSLLRAVTLRNAQVKHRLYNKYLMIWYQILFKMQLLIIYFS